MKRAALAGLISIAALVLCASPALAGGKLRPHGPYTLTAQKSDYGAKKPVANEKEARAALEEYFKGKDVTVGKIEEKELFFEAGILDKKGKVVDKVIIDKRTGRIRSIY